MWCTDSMIDDGVSKRLTLTQRLNTIRAASSQPAFYRLSDGEGWVSSTSRTLRARAIGLNGFCRNATPGSSAPWRTMASSV